MKAGSHHIQKYSSYFAPSPILAKTNGGLLTAYIQTAENTPIYLHSRYDPVKEAQVFAEAQLRNVQDDNIERIVVYGVGCGYHVKALLEATELMGVQIEVWETNVQAFHEIYQTTLVSELLADSRVVFIVSDELQVFSNQVAEWQGCNVHVVIHTPSLRAMPRELEPLKDVLQNYQVYQNSAVRLNDEMIMNFRHNTAKDLPSLSALKKLSPVSIPILLISAGPSLEKLIPFLQQASKHCMLGAVGTAIAPLWKNRITPDFVVMTDPQPGMMQQLEGWESADIPLFFLSTLSKDVVEHYQGPKCILYQEGFGPAELEATRRGEKLVQTGGSVSTTLFSLAKELGFQPICLIGQDLAYTDDKTHIEGTPMYQEWKHSKGECVLAFDEKGTVIAPRNLLLYKKWFERQAVQDGISYYNATEGGAYIEGFKHLSLQGFIKMVEGVDVSEKRRSFHDVIRSASS
ncbi:motility associated factor glycosyltransferase family protein [Brevibacillus agri]|uniref:motility associated factor glycosyltransferase family protein n=1 Tax=Brevibacillus agri TaxID=51101 RepID=UPI003D9A4D78